MARKTILITGATDGIGLEAAKRLASRGHDVLLHGRNPAKLEAARQRVASQQSAGQVGVFQADLSRLGEVDALARAVAAQHDGLDVLINNAGVFKAPEPVTADGLDVRFIVNTLAPYLLTRRLLPLMDASGRVINVASAAQAPVDPTALAGRIRLDDDMAAYAQSKLALIMWSFELAHTLDREGPAIIAVNPGSLLGTKMVQEAFGMAGKDVGIGADILACLALDAEFVAGTGRYFDNDSGHFANPHADALDEHKRAALVESIEAVLAGWL